jgi:thiol-disulfide isomerase/thioredoxin/biotin operon repressor
VSQFEETLLQKTTQAPINSSNGQLFNVNPPTKAPELEGIGGWINSDGEKISNLKGKVVLVDFWTYSCVNCLRSSPYINSWYNSYKDQGFTVLGIHAPEFAFEKNKENVEKSVKDTYKIQYPVGLDNDFKTWDAYKNQFWPAKYLIDKDGNLRYTHFGEGEYDKTEQAIRVLLQENGQKLTDTMATDKVTNTMISTEKLTPETYLGWGRSDRQQNDSKVYNKPNSYTFGLTLKPNFWDLDGAWQIDNEQIISKDSKSKLRLHYSAREVYIVAGSSTTAKLGVSINQKIATLENKGIDVDSNGQLPIQEDRLYRVVKHDTLTDGYLELTVPEGTHLNVFTFG